MRIDEAGHDDAALHVDIGGAFDALYRAMDASVSCRHDCAVAHGDEAVGHGADVTGGRPHARTLVFQRREREESRAMKDKVRLGHSRK